MWSGPSLHLCPPRSVEVEKIMQTMILSEVLEAADQLSLEEQEYLINILRKRMIERRRMELAKDIEEAREEFKKGHCQPATPSEIMEEILS